MRHEEPAEVVWVTYKCDECEEDMSHGGTRVLLSGPPLYPHRCPNGHTKNLDATYPHSQVRPRQ